MGVAQVVDDLAIPFFDARILTTCCSYIYASLCCMSARFVRLAKTVITPEMSALVDATD
jgi:hypothetical protein